MDRIADLFDVLPSSYLRRLRGGVGWHVTGCTRNKRGLVQRLAEGGAKDGGFCVARPSSEWAAA
jgi:hypothetical protein